MKRLAWLAILGAALSGSSWAASAGCVVSAAAPQLRASGIAEVIGDVVLDCPAGMPSWSLNGNLVFYLPANVTNAVDTAGAAIGATVAVDTGAGYVNLAAAGTPQGHLISFNGVTVPAPGGVAFSLRVSGIRMDVSALGQGTDSVTAYFSSFLQVDRSVVVVGYKTTALYASISDAGIPCTGSYFPLGLTLSNLFLSGTTFASTRFTEGYGNAFGSGVRLLVRYSGLPGAARLVVPTLLAGSSAVTPTSGGDLGLPQAVGRYLPGSGTLLLGLVTGANAQGAGGTVTAAPTGFTAVDLNDVRELSVSGGAATAVYEVLDSSVIARESVQFPVFVAVPNVTTVSYGTETVTMAPVSTVHEASTSAPVPRFVETEPASDCSVLGDCSASWFPHLEISNTGVALRGVAGSSLSGNSAYVNVYNTGGGLMAWNVSTTYTEGSGWLSVSQSSSVNSGSLIITGHPDKLPAGIYHASIAVGAGTAGSAAIAVTYTVSDSGTNPGPVISAVVNAASMQSAALVPGSISTLWGAYFASDATVTFDGTAGRVLYADASQINVVVPVGLASATARVVVTANGLTGTALTWPVAAAVPAIFPGAAVNADGSANSASNPALRGAALTVFATGFPAGQGASARMGGVSATGFSVSQDSNGVLTGIVTIPTSLDAGSTTLTLCTVSVTPAVCTDPYSITLR
jgi:uncharacterized protein (TIGR03437 family)